VLAATLGVELLMVCTSGWSCTTRVHHEGEDQGYQDQLKGNTELCAWLVSRVWALSQVHRFLHRGVAMNPR
jgi:hypothetical protein